MLVGLVYDIIFLCISFIIYFTYHVYLFIRVKNSKTSHLTWIGRNDSYKRQWIELMVSGKKDILAVQTLRNMVMASSLLATASITLVVLLLNILVSNNLSNVFDQISIIGATNSRILVYKSFLLILVFLFAFLNFATAIRYTTHLAFLINVAPYHSECTPRYLNKIMHNASNHHTFGVRSFYFSLPVILWFFDPIFLLTGTLMLTVWLYFGDISDLIIPIEEKKNKSKRSSDTDLEALELPSSGAGAAVSEA
ncbi:hypothetical protein SAMD00019534_058520, partial [Acytostelium subglobosum LB1]|uniref:hypothetical protein n=1 Tax=Acytostelium subglobosum LB1 TaxID=1410327 RepID=UPI00064514DD